MANLDTEKVTQNREVAPGQYGTKTFWIAYPDYVSAYGHVDDRITRAWGQGGTKAEALKNAADPSTDPR